jgi:transcriptional regulator with XRE-family HTH domain
MTIDYKSIGEKVRASRVQRGMRQWQLAEKTGMSDVYISYIETGTKRPSLDAILKIAMVLGIFIDSLVCDDWLARLPKGYREIAELLADCNIDECERILRVASAYKALVIGQQVG